MRLRLATIASLRMEAFWSKRCTLLTKAVLYPTAGNPLKSAARCALDGRLSVSHFPLELEEYKLFCRLGKLITEFEALESKKEKQWLVCGTVNICSGCRGRATRHHSP